MLFSAAERAGDQTARVYVRQITWWATAVEAISSFNRLYRDQALTAAGKQQANQLAQRLGIETITEMNRVIG